MMASCFSAHAQAIGSSIFNKACVIMENDDFATNVSSSTTRPTGRVDCNQSAMAGFAAMHG
jgi:hypothetical protein